MANTCKICLKSITGKQTKLTCCDCTADFHASCAKMSKSDIDYLSSAGLTWRCTPCGSTRRQSMRLESQAAEGGVTMEDVMKILEEMRQEQRQSVQDFNRSFEDHNRKIEESTAALTNQTAKLEEYFAKMELICSENERLKKKICILEERLDEMEQYSRSNMVEIHGVPTEDNEDILNVVKKVGVALDMNIENSMVDICHRLGKKNDSKGPPGIVVKFVRRMDKEELLRRRRVKRNLSTRHMGLSSDVPVYINESLSPARRRLYALARQEKRQRGYKYLWLRGGRILMRKEESARVVQISSQADLEGL